MEIVLRSTVPHYFTSLWILSGTTRVSRYQKKHSPTHTYHGHQSSLSASSSITIHGILLVQFTCLTLFFHNPSCKFSLVYLLAWHPPLHTPYNHCLLFAAHAHTFKAISSKDSVYMHSAEHGVTRDC